MPAVKWGRQMGTHSYQFENTEHPTLVPMLHLGTFYATLCVNTNVKPNLTIKLTATGVRETVLSRLPPPCHDQRNEVDQGEKPYGASAQFGR